MTNGKKSDYNITLTGFMGTGKTTVGRMLAESLGFEFVDTDALIEETSGKGIPEIFATMGEGAFRQLEQEAAQALAQKRGQIISTGGRMMLDPANKAALEPTGPIFCLVASVDEIFRRVTADAEGIERPLLKGDDPKGRIESLLAERRDLYGQYPQIDTEGLTPDAIRDEILSRLT